MYLHVFEELYPKRLMSKKKKTTGAPHHTAQDGYFRQSNREDETFKVCDIEGTEIRVWGAEGFRALQSDLIAALRPIIKRVQPTSPIALMPDFHPGEAGVIGSVIVSERHLVPDIIGGDCGCGVFAARLNCGTEELTEDRRRTLFRNILGAVPVGRAQNREILPHLERLQLWDTLSTVPFATRHDVQKLRRQLGSLGGGNHFIELASADNGAVWLLVHSGSRYLGGLLMQHYRGQNIPVDAASEYVSTQAAVLEFARASRQEMAGRVVNCLRELDNLQDCKVCEQIDLPHNFIELRTSSSGISAIHRKGACAAMEGQPGVIPGSMGTGSYIVEGRGSAASYSSSSHGAGRTMPRSQAFRTLSFKEIVKDMQGIVWAESERLKDEAPKAYKNIESVIRAERDLIKIRCRLRPILSVKGEV